jgi:hypothetical protein
LFNTFGAPFTFQNPAANFDVILRELSYMFPVGDSLTLEVGPRINWYSYFDNNRYTFFLTGANSFNSSGGTQVNTIDRGAGALRCGMLPTGWMCGSATWPKTTNSYPVCALLAIPPLVCLAAPPP